MKVLVTGSEGFIGRNLVATLNTKRDIEILKYDLDTPQDMLEEYCAVCDFVYHLAGVNRPEDVTEYMTENLGITSTLLSILENHHNKCPIMFASSIQALSDNPYGQSKRASENTLKKYSSVQGAQVYIYRFPNLYGKWCKPNYNSVVSTFCYNITRDIPIKIHDPSTALKLVYIDDVVNELVSLLQGHGHCDKEGVYYVPESSTITLGDLANMLYTFKEERNHYFLPNVAENSFSKKLYSTFLSYLPTEKLNYPLCSKSDNRGSFTEILKTVDRGQISINISHPGVEKGNHWHNTKNEKFIVLKGKALVQMRKIGKSEVINYHLSGEKLEILDIPCGYTHNLINEGNEELITLMWANECYDPQKPDTYYQYVNGDI